MRRWVVPFIAVLVVGLLAIAPQTVSYAGALFEAPGSSEGDARPVLDTGDLTFYAIYDRLADTAGDNLLIDHTAMSADGKKLIFGGRDAGTKQSRVFTADLDTGKVSRVSLSPELAGRGIDEFTMNADGSRAFFRVASCCDSTKSIYKLENGGVTQIFDSSTHKDIGGGIIHELQTTASGEHVYFLDDAPNDNDVWRIGYDGSGLELVINDSMVPNKNGAGAQVAQFAISSDASVIAFTLHGYWAPKEQRSGIFDNGYREKVNLFSLSKGGFTQLTNGSPSILSDKLAISGDGGTITFAGEGKRYAMGPQGGSITELGPLGSNAVDPVLTYDGSFMVYSDKEADGGSILYSNGSGRYALFPNWDVNAITIAVHHGLSMSDRGDRISFVVNTSSFPTKNSLYVGYLDPPEILRDAPAVHSIAFDPPALPNNNTEARITVMSRVEDAQGVSDITRTEINQLLDGRIVSTNTSDGPFRVKYGGRPRDDGEAQDLTGNDGTFSAQGFPSNIAQRFDQLTVRVAFMDKSRSVTVADTLLPVGAYVPPAGPTPPPAGDGFPNASLLLEASPTQAQPGDTINLTYRGAPGHQSDWIALFPVNSRNQEYGQWFYLESDRQGSLTFTAPEVEGIYEFRMFANWPDGGYEDIARSNQLTITSRASISPTPGPTARPTPSPTQVATPDGVVLAVQSRTAAPGGTVQVPIRLEQGGSISSLGFNFTYDPLVVEVSSVLKGSVTAPATFTYNADTPGVVRFGYASTSQMNGTGSVAAVEFRVKGDRGSVSRLTLSEGLVTNGSGSNLPVQLVNGNITIEQRLPGDGNGDGRVTVLDALIALRMFVQVVPPDPVMDVNGDGQVTPEDARQILTMASPGYRN